MARTFGTTLGGAARKRGGGAGLRRAIAVALMASVGLCWSSQVSPRSFTAPGAKTHRLFVYGTLKNGFTNHDRYLGVAEEHGKAKFVGVARTKDVFPLVVKPVDSHLATRAPVLMDKTGTGHQVVGEIYEVDGSTLEALDLLEGVRSAKYYAKQISVIMDHDDEVELPCSAYFFPANDELLNLPHFPDYNDEHHAIYNPRPVDEEILRLCMPQKVTMS